MTDRQLGRADCVSKPAPARILLAEDDPAMRSVVAETLRKDGHVVVEIADGGKLLVTLAKEVVLGGAPVDLLVADIRMPVCTGLQIVEQMRAIQSRVPVILMTAFGDPATRARAVALDALLFDKPFAMSQLRAAVVAILSRPRLLPLSSSDSNDR